MRRSLRLPLSLAVAAALAAAAVAADLPPKEAPPYTAVYKVSSKSKDKPNDPWTYTTEDTVTIAVNGAKQARWDHQSDGRTTLIDQVARTATSFGGQTPPQTAVRSRAPFVPIGWEFGYGTVTAATEQPPEVLGTDTIAGVACTKLKMTSEQYGEPEYCVAKSGVVLRFANRSSTSEAEYVAQSVTETAPDAARFSVPAGYAVEERAGPRRNVRIF